MHLRRIAHDQPVLTMQLLPVDAVPELGWIWTELQARATGSFFLSWLWIGCWLDHIPHGTRAYAWIARHEDRVVGLAILCRNTRRRLGLLRIPSWFLHETGDDRFDRLTIEDNGILADRDHADAVIAAGFDWMTRHLPDCTELVLGGLDRQAELLARHVAEERGYPVNDRRIETARWVDLNALRRQGGNYRRALGRNTRSAVNRAQRLYEARGPLAFEVAGSPEQGLAFFDGLEKLHRESWAARGKRDSFANPAFGPFHRDLIARGIAAGAVRLCRISAGSQCIGYLYNFIWRGQVLNYQSGFLYEDDNRLKPGLVSHVLAIEDALARGEEGYDFLAGNAAHKAHLSNAERPMNWIALGPDRTIRRIDAASQRAEDAVKRARREWLRWLAELRARRRPDQSGGSQSGGGPKTSVALVPPKPKELDRT